MHTNDDLVYARVPEISKPGFLRGAQRDPAPGRNWRARMNPLGNAQRKEALSAIGLDENELQIYELLLAQPNLVASDVAEVCGVGNARAMQLLRSLELNGLVSRSPERVPRYRAAPPDLGIGALVAKRQSELQTALTLAEQLATRRPSSKTTDSGELTVELITGREALVRVISQSYDSAKHEILEMDRPPYLNTYEQHDEMRVQIFGRGVSFRTIVDTAALKLPGRVQHIRDSIAAGEDTRLLNGVPIKAAIIDRRMALVPLHLKSASESGLILRPSLLLDVLCSHFELLWRQSVPFGKDPQDASQSVDEQDEFAQLIVLLANGHADKAVWQRLGLSQRTFERRMAELHERLGAKTRFEAGWKAAMQMLKLDGRDGTQEASADASRSNRSRKF